MCRVRDETLASCAGKPVTLDHPDDFVTPATFSQLGKGVMLNIRRGEGLENDLILADLLITAQDAIAAVQDEEIEEVSLGYEADYEQVSPGRGVQRNIVVNHVAIVPRGRCGPRCAIGDKEPEMKTKDSKTKARTWLDRVRTAFKAQDAEALEEALAESKTGDADEEDQEDDKESKTADAIAALTKTVKLHHQPQRISAVHFQGLRITTPDGQPATLAVVDMQGRVIESGQTVVRAAWEVAIKAYRNFLSDKGILRVKTISPDKQPT